jgi:3-phenylpropionate/cinnamic acid dioxygenase small subunit
LNDSVRDRTDITDVLVRYATGIDRRDWALFRTCWAEDIDANYGRGIGHFHSADEITNYMTEAHADMGPTWHRLSNFSIEVDGDTATARTYLHAVLNVDKGDSDRWMEVMGHYDDLLVRSAAGWKIQRRRVGRPRITGTQPPGLDL